MSILLGHSIITTMEIHFHGDLYAGQEAIKLAANRKQST